MEERPGSGKIGNQLEAKYNGLGSQRRPGGAGVFPKSWRTSRLSLLTLFIPVIVSGSRWTPIIPAILGPLCPFPR